MSGRIIAHIAGLPNNYKQKFIDDFNQFAIDIKQNIILVDLDEITMQIISEQNIITLYN